jgi:O-antigen/teichoic acid export membrane protein
MNIGVHGPSEPEAAAVAERDLLDSREAGGKVIRGGGLRVGSYVGGLLIGLISAPLLVRHLSVEDYGLFVTASSIVFVVAGLTEGGLGNVAVREYAVADRAERAKLLDSLLGLRFVLTTAGLAAAIGFTLVAGYDEAVVAGTAIAGSGLFMGVWQNTLAISLQSELRLGTLAAADLVRQIAFTAVIATLVIAGAGLIAFYSALPVALAFMLAVTIAATAGSVRLRPALDLVRWARLARETALYALASALGVVYFQVAIISVSLLSTDTQAGYYGASFRIVELANGVPWLLASAAFPVLARAAYNDADRLRYATQRLFETALLVGGLFAVGIAVGAPFALQVVGGDKLDPAITTLRILAFGVPFTFLIATWAFTLLSLRLHRSLVVANGLAVAVALVLTALLVPDHGARGAAITTAALEVVLAVAYAVSLARARADLRPSLAVLPRVLAASGAALLAGFLVPLPVLPATLLALAVYAVLARLLGAVPAEIAEAVRQRLRPKE